MGLIRFQVDTEEKLADSTEAAAAYMTGLDGQVFPSRMDVSGNELSCQRSTSESGKLNIAWPVDGFGRPVSRTCSLREREAPYVLAVELARGKLSQLRDQRWTWQLAGMLISDEFVEKEKKSFQLFREAASSQDDLVKATTLADQSLSLSYECAELLAVSYTEQRLTFRRQRLSHPPALQGCQLAQAQFADDQEGQELGEKFREAFHSAVVPVEWKLIEPTEGEYNWELADSHVEFCAQKKLHPYGGPLLDLGLGGLPPWLQNWEHDFLNLQSFVCDFVETAVSRYVGKIRNWEVCARANSGGALVLSEENRLTLTARVLDIARQVDDENQLYIRVDQPWGDYQIKGQHRLSPFQFVDALYRSGIGLSGVNLELAIGYRGQGAGVRDLFDISRLIDVWSAFGKPLFVTIAFPSSTQQDSNTTQESIVEPGQWRRPWSDGAQAEWVDLCLPMLMAKQAVVGVYWTHYTDAHPHRFANSGLVHPDGTFKPAMERMIALRKLNEGKTGATPK